MGRSVSDIDLLVEGSASRLARLLADRLGGTAHCNARFTTAKWVPPDSNEPPIDLASSRQEVYDRPAALPRVQSADLQTDLHRRDFTINAMAISLRPAELGRLVDPFDGYTDLENKTLRILHPRSFHDDPTRAYRGARFAGRLGFQLDSQSQTQLEEALSDDIVSRLTKERIGNEIERIFAEARPIAAWDLVESWKLLAPLHPELGRAANLSAELEAMLTARSIFAGWHGSAPPRSDVLWKALGDQLSAGAREALIRLVPGGGARHTRWKAGMPTTLTALETLRNAREPAVAGKRLSTLDAVERIALLRQTQPESTVRRWLSWWEDTGRGIQTAVTGRDLIAAGCAPGPRLGEALRAARDAAWNGKAPEEQLALALACARAD